MKKILFLILIVLNSILMSYNKCLYKKKITFINSPNPKERMNQKDFLEFLLLNQCNINLKILDDKATQKLGEKMPYVKFKKEKIINVIRYLLKNKYFYWLENEHTMDISYYVTKTYKLNLLALEKKGDNIIKGEDISIQDDYSNKIWTNIEEHINKILKNVSPDDFKPSIIDKEAGLITVTGTVHQLEHIEKYIKELEDRLKKQVLIDVKIYSVKLNKGKNLGINWENFKLSFGGVTSLTTRNILGSQSIFKTNQFNANGFINFLKTYGKVTVISSPKIVSLNNQKSMINIGDVINYQIEKVTTDANGNIVKSYIPGKVFVGLVLDVLPQIHNDKITLNIQTQLSTLRNPQQLIDIANGIRKFPPDTSTKNILSEVILKNNQTLILGGIITQTVSNSNSSVPILRYLPILGGLFKGESNLISRQEIIFVITPHIINLNKK